MNECQHIWRFGQDLKDGTIGTWCVQCSAIAQNVKGKDHDWENRRTPEGYLVMHCKICNIPYWGDVNISMLRPCPIESGKFNC